MIKSLCGTIPHQVSMTKTVIQFMYLCKYLHNFSHCTKSYSLIGSLNIKPLRWLLLNSLILTLILTLKRYMLNYHLKTTSEKVILTLSWDWLTVNKFHMLLSMPWNHVICCWSEMPHEDQSLLSRHLQSWTESSVY